MANAFFILFLTIFSSSVFFLARENSFFGKPAAVNLTVCYSTDDEHQPLQDMFCPTWSTCCPAQYSPTGQGCENGDGTCCLLGAANTPESYDNDLPNCLIMGDSVSIGYTYSVTNELASICNVQHSPWDVTDGGWSNSSYARSCLDIMLLTATSEQVAWDVIFFNNGLHNLDDNSTAAVEAYQKDLVAIADRLVATGATVLYGLTTPQMTYYNPPMSSTIVEELNAAASEVMAARDIPITDLYARVEEYCGPVPYVYCEICSDYPGPCDYHYTTDGYTWIGQNVTDAIAGALSSKNAKAPRADYRTPYLF